MPVGCSLLSNGCNREFCHNTEGTIGTLDGSLLHVLPPLFQNTPKLAVPCRIPQLEQLNLLDPSYQQKKAIVEERLAGGLC
jgi:hypothetical protein